MSIHYENVRNISTQEEYSRMVDFYEKAWNETYNDKYKILTSENIHKLITKISRENKDAQKRFANLPAEDTFILVYEGDEIIGALHAIQKETRIWLKSIYVLEAYQNQGIGRELLRRLESKYKDAGLPYVLDVEERNENAIAFYKKMGFFITKAPMKIIDVEGQELREITMKKLPEDQNGSDLQKPEK